MLAGGKSTRMGTDKAFLEWQGQTLLARALKLAESVASSVRIVGDAGKFAPFGHVVEDTYHHCGPLAGIHAALAMSDAELNLVLAVDLPFMESEFLNYLISQAMASHAVVTVPHMAGGRQPLCAVYRARFAAVAESALREGRNKIDPLFAEVETRVIAEAEIRHAGFSELIFQNLNTPEDYAAAKSPSSSISIQPEPR